MARESASAQVIEQAPSTQVTEVAEKSTERPMEIAPGVAVRVGGVAGVATSFPEDGKVIVETEDGKILPYDESEVEVVGETTETTGTTETTMSDRSNESNWSAEPEPVGVGKFGEIYDQFKGKVKEAVAFLLRRKNGEAVGALHHGEVGDISVVYGNDGYGLAHIAKKHPEVLNDLQGTIDGMVVTSQSDNRIVLESSTHRAVISKMLGNEPTSNWLLTAYEKKNPASASSSDIETEPEGKQNGTATLQNEISEGEDSENKSDMQEGGVNSPAIPVDAKGEPMYESAPVEATIADIYNDPDLDEDEADAFVQAKIDGATKRIAQLEKKKPKMGESKVAFKEAKAKWREQLEAEQASLAYWQGVQEAVPEMRRKERAKRQMEADIAQREREQQERAEQSRRAEERGRNRGDYRKAIAGWEDTPSSFHEYVAQALLVGNHKMRWNDNGSTRGLGSHTTGRRGVNRRGEVVTARNDESRAMGWLIDDRGGLSPEALADKLWNEYTGSYGEDMSEGSPLDVLLDVVTSMPTPQMMWDYVKGEHDARMEAEQGGYEEQYSAEEIEAFERDAMYREKYGVSEEEYWANEAQWDEFIESREMSAEELGNYDNFVAEERKKEEHGRRNQENAEDEQRTDNRESEGSVEVLSGTQPDITRGNEDVAGESEGVDGNGVESNDVASEEAAELSEEDRQAIENMPIPMLKRQIKDTATTLFNVSQTSDQWQAENKDKIERAKLLLAYAKQELARKERLKKSNKWGVKVGNTATPFDVVRKMFEEFNSNEDLAQLFEKVAKVFETLPIKVVFSDTIGGKSTQGWFSPTTGTLKLPGYFVYGGGISEQNKAETILHEMIHAVTTYALYINEKPYLQTELGFRLSDDMHAAIRQLKRIYASIANDKDFKGEYGAVSVHEMIAELSNVQFREKLKKKGLWETIVDAIKQLFGITPSNALEGAEAALEYMLNNFDRSQWEKMAGMGEKRGKQMRIGVDKQIIGEKGASALDKADEATHRMDNLGVAREMEADGKDAKAIRMATGWERGADGKWRYEIEDYSIKEEKIDFITNQLDHKNTATIILKDLLEDAQGLFAAYPELRNMRVVIKKDSSVIGQGELQWYDAVYDRQIVLNEAAIISHFAKSALERYGKADVGIIRIKQGYDPTTKEKFTNEADKQEALKTYIEMMNEALLDYHRFKSQNKDIATSILTHEIQHAIQFIEGFARGSSPKEFADVRGAVLDSIDFMTNGDLLKGNSISNSQSLRDALNKKIPYTNISLKEGYIDNLQKVARKYGYDNIDALVDDFEKMPSAFEQYHRTAGEVEARNASARMGMSADERRATLLSETEDVAREDQIFLMENSGVSAMAEGEINDLISQMKANASVEPIVEISEENWVDKIGTPIGEVKMGEHQKSKLFNKGREKQYGMLLETLSNPDIVLEEQSKEDPTHERDSAYLFIKTFQKEDGSKYVHFESVTVKQDGLEVSISSHIIRENQLRNKMKRDRLLYKATALDQSTNSSAEQSIKGGSLSSIGKGSDNIGDVQGLEDYSAEEIKEIARGYIEEVIAESGFDADVVDLAIYGSRRRGDGRDDSDLDIVVEYSGNAREDDLFNALNDAETQLEIDGVKVDINPITKSKSGTLGEFMERAREYDESNESNGSNGSNESKVVKVDKDTKEGEPLSREATAPLSEQGSSDEGLMFRDGDVFYSNAEEAVRNIKQEKATPEQWLAMIQKNGGLKAGEDKWLGLSEWLKGSDAKTLTKEEVLEFIAQNKIKIEEVGYGGDSIASAQSEFDELTEELGGYDEAFEEMVNRYGDDFREAVWYDEVGQLHLEDGYEDYGEILGIERGINRTRLDYTTEGLENKKEIALVVPSVDPYNAHDEIHFGDAGGGRAVAWVRFGETRVPRQEEVKRSADELEVPYKNANGRDVWRVKGRKNDYIAHSKLKNGMERYLIYVNDKLIGTTLEDTFDTLEEAQAAMNRYYAEHPVYKTVYDNVLVIDEIQSKRHQDGREKGYRDADVPNRVEDARKAVAEAEREFADFRNAMQEKYDYDSLVQGSAEERKEGRKAWRGKFTPEEMIKYDQLHDATIDARNALEEARQAQSKVPDAPFEKNWHELAMKRMLRYAAENGFDKVAWTTGAQQAERYSMGRLFNDIEREDNPNLEGRRFVLSGANAETIQVDDNGNITASTISEAEGKSLQEVVGKEMAIKMMNLEDGDLIENEDLRIGGEGMKGFYDKMLPSFMNKYGKKWGVKVGEVTMPELQEGYQTMHSIDVTDDMKESVMEGQPMFREGDGEMNDAEVSMANDPIAKVMGKSQRSKKQQAKFAERERKYMRNRVAELAEKMGISDRVTVVSSEEIVDSSERKVRAKGWFDTRTGKIVINISNHLSVADVERTLLHEAVAHYGLRQLFGKQFDTFLDNVYLHADAEVRAQIIELAKKHGWDFRTATEEYLAGLAEDTNFEYLEYQTSFWMKIKRFFMDMLESIGWDYKGPELSDNELRYLLWRSYENMVNPGRHRSILGKAEDVAKQYALGVGNYSADAETMSQVAEEGEKAEPQPIGNGAFGAIYTQFRGKAKEAIAFLMRKQSGEAIGALSHPEIGEIDLVWGKEGTSHSDGYGLAKLVKYHPEVLDNLQEILSGMNVVKRSPNRVQLESNTHKASVRLTWDNQRKTWLLTAFEKKETPETTISSTGVDNSPKGLLDDTAPQQSSSVSADKVNNNNSEKQENNESNGSNGSTNAERDSDEGILFRDGESDGTREEYDRRVRRPNRSGSVGKWDNLGWRMKEAYQDSMLSLKELQEVIAKKYGLKEIPSWMNAYLQENLMSSRNKAASDVYMRDFYNPMMKEVQALIKKGVKYEDLVNYMIAKHGLERNVVMAERDAKRAADEAKEKGEDWQKAYDEALKENRKRDYSGLTALTGEESVMTAEKVAEKMALAKCDYDTTFSPMIEAKSVKMKNNRRKFVGSLKTKMPIRAVPSAPMPVQMA